MDDDIRALFLVVMAKSKGVTAFEFIAVDGANTMEDAVDASKRVSIFVFLSALNFP